MEQVTALLALPLAAMALVKLGAGMKFIGMIILNISEI
jgi:hypothetical protein